MIKSSDFFLNFQFGCKQQKKLMKNIHTQKLIYLNVNSPKFQWFIKKMLSRAQKIKQTYFLSSNSIYKKSEIGTM